MLPLRSLVVAGALLLALGACAPSSNPPDGEATGLSRSTRSQNYCARIGGAGTGFYDSDRMLACRRSEYTAEAFARGLPPVPPAADAECDGRASFGNALAYFSWVAYVDCVSDVTAP